MKKNVELNRKTSAFEIFEISNNDLKRIFETTLRSGGDFSDVYFERKETNFISLEDSAVNKAYTGLDSGAGIRVVSDDQTGYSFTEELNLSSMLRSAKIASSIAEKSGSVKYGKMDHLESNNNFYPVKDGWNDVAVSEKMKLLKYINERIFSMDNRIKKVNISYTDVNRDILIASSDGKYTFDRRPMTIVSVSCTAEQKGRKESNGFSVAVRKDLSFLTDEELSRIADESVDRTIRLFEAVQPRGGEMEVILSCGSSGILLHEAIGHGLEADFNRKGISAFSDKMGNMISDKTVSIVDDGTIMFDRGAVNIDDENIEGKRTVLVNEGKLESYIHDRISAGFYGVKPTGNGRRESFRFQPMPRMRNTYMMPGPYKRDDLIRSVKKGIIAESFSNGQVLIGAGDFTFYVKSGFLIEDGKITTPIKDINIIGNGPEVLSRIVMVADDFKLAEGGWTCGKNGQGVPVSMGLPTVKVSSMIVGGM